MEHWYTLHTKPNAEYQVATALTQRGLQTYLPEIETVKPRQGRVNKPFFPCYLFLRVDFAQIGFAQVQWTPGLRRVIAFDHQPVALPDEVIDLIRLRLGELERSGGWVCPFKPGETVRIIDGPFREMLAIFDRPTSSAERVQVLLHILGHASRAELSVHDLAKAPPGAEPPPLEKRPRRSRGRGRPIKAVAWPAG